MYVVAYLLNALKYDFKSDDGRQISGVSVRFIVPDDEEETNTNQIGSSIQKMSMPLEKWESLQAQGLHTFSKVKLTFSGFGRHSRLVKVEKVTENG